MNQPSLFVIDDEPDNFDVIEACLAQCGDDLHYSSSGQEALNSLSIFQPDIILLDVMMPRLNGIEVCQQLKNSPDWQAIPIIMVTALSTKEDLARCLGAGTDDFISKPFNGIELRARIQSLVRIKRQYDHLKTLAQLEINTIDLLHNNLRELRSSLFSTLPHELNTPLNGISGVITLMRSIAMTPYLKCSRNALTVAISPIIGSTFRDLDSKVFDLCRIRTYHSQ